MVDKGIETAKAKKALKNVAVLMEKHNERQHPSPDKVDEEFAPKEQKPKYDPKARGNNGARRLEHMECEERVIIEEPYISGDETFHKVRVGDKNDKGLQIRKGYIWDLVAHHLGLAYFFYSRGSRSEKVFEEIIEGYRGTFQSDAMPVYRKLGDGKYDGITRIPCLQHIKRRFVDIREVPRAAGILRLFNLLYDREHRHRIGHDGWTVADNLK